MPASPAFRAFIDESSALRGPERQEYLLCAALVPEMECDWARDRLRPLLLPGQIKVHWTDESERRRRALVDRVLELGPMSVVVTHLGERRRKVERYRRKCLEMLYHQLIEMAVFELTLESRSSAQDRGDVAHIVALQGQGMDRRVRINHLRGGDDPLLWISDIVLGAINSAHLGDDSYLIELQSTLVIEDRTPDSLTPSQDERP